MALQNQLCSIALFLSNLLPLVCAMPWKTRPCPKPTSLRVEVCRKWSTNSAGIY